MNQMLIEAIKEVEALPDAEQEELGRELMRLAARKRIDAMLAEAEARGGGKPHDEFMAELEAKYGVLTLSGLKHHRTTSMIS